MRRNVWRKKLEIKFLEASATFKSTYKKNITLYNFVYLLIFKILNT
jgi:hypothetical protein